MVADLLSKPSHSAAVSGSGTLTDTRNLIPDPQSCWFQTCLRTSHEYFSLSCDRAALLSVWVDTQSDECSYVFVDLGSLDLYMISTHLTVDLRCCASVSNHGMVRSVQVSVKKSKRMPALSAFSCAFVWHSVNPSFFIGASLRVAGAMNGASQ